MFHDLKSVTFSELIRHNADSIAIFSPNGLMLVCASDCQAIIWNVSSKEILHKFICDNPINNIEWSPNSELIYCLLKKNSIQVWNLAIPSWRCKITENPLAIVDVYWAPDSQHLIVVSEFHIKLTVWSLVSKSITVIENPKTLNKCIAFSSCSRYMAVVEKKKSDDFIGIYTCDTWELLKCFNVETNDVTAIYFSPSELVIGVLEAASEKNRVLFYSVDGRLLGKFSNLCSNVFSWSPCGKFSAIGDYYGEVTIIHSFDYNKLTSFQLSENIDSESVVMYRAVPKSSTTFECASNLEIFEVIKDRPVSLLSLSNQPEKIKSKTHFLQWSYDEQYIASVNVSMSNILFIYDTRKFELSDVIVYHCKIRSVAWHPEKHILAISSGTSNLNLWTPSYCISCVPPFKSEFAISSVAWCPTKDCVILNSKDESSILYLPTFCS